ncbi:MAG: MFS transporter [SAR86 cluster bacterium]|uniref:MFS transporter n=1 Tax=SAR86 cluster bacterium TaxID=2030880 RepID=A0A2A5CCP4_9GAMM|nr:MAG: MFS transporter [SAR86 cluster bacterium]
MSLVIVGEAIFLLPFVLSRVFRPTFLDVFGISNLQLGTAFSLYGVVAMFSYFAGGPLADRFSARRLIVTAMLFTSAGGLLMATIPALGWLTLLYAFWGLTTIFLFWGALIKTTRELGNSNQGQTFGLLDGGRGLFAAVLSSFSVFVFAALLPEDVASATFEQRSAALSIIILIFSGLGLVSALLVWFFVPESKEPVDVHAASRPLINLQSLKQISSMRAVWLQALIILCAYVAYKSTDDFSLYARDAFGYNEVQAAQIGTLSFWMRPIAAVGVGFLADKLNSQGALLGSFAVVMAGSLVISTGVLVPGVTWLLFMTIAATSAGIYGLRGLYFSTLGEARVPLAYTGAAVGLVSFIGYTPDVFMGPLMGYLLDRTPGAIGHQHVFTVIFAFGLLGFITTLLFNYTINYAKKAHVVRAAKVSE